MYFEVEEWTVDVKDRTVYMYLSSPEASLAHMSTLTSNLVEYFLHQLEHPKYHFLWVNDPGMSRIASERPKMSLFP